MSPKRRSPKPHVVNTKDPRYNVEKYRRGGSIFFESKFDKYSDMVRIDRVDEARISADRLMDEFTDAKQMAKKRRIINIANLASNRARAISQRKDVSPEERKQSREIAQIYRRTQERLSRQYERDKRNESP